MSNATQTSPPRTVSKNRAKIRTVFELATMYGFMPRTLRFKPDDGTDTGHTETKTETKVEEKKVDPYEDRFSKLEQQLNGLSATLRQVNKQVKPPVEKKESEEDRTLTARVAATEEREKKVRQREQFNALNGALQDNGIHKDQAPRFAKMILGEESDNIEMDESDPLIPRVLYKESDEKKTPVNEWMKAYLASDKGSWMKPPKPTANSEGMNRQSSNDGTNIQGWTPKSKNDARKDPDRFAALISTDAGKKQYSALPDK